MEIGLFILAVTLSALCALTMIVIGASIEWEEPCDVRLPAWGDVLAAIALLITQAVCWGIWGIVHGGPA